MKRKLLILGLLGSMNPVCGAENISSEDGYAIVVGIAGMFTTAASFVCWYFHQKMLKEDFSKKESASFHTINELRGALNLPLLPNPQVISISGPGGVERLPAQQHPLPRPLSPHALEQLFADDGVGNDMRGIQRQLSQGSLPPYDFGPLPHADRLPGYESPISLDAGRLPEEMALNLFRVTNALVGSLNPSPTAVGYSFEGLEQEA